MLLTCNDGTWSQGGAVLPAEAARKCGLDTAIWTAPAPWRKPRTVRDPGKALVDVALGVVLGGVCLADVTMLRTEPDVCGPVASDPTVCQLVDSLAAAGPKALTAIRWLGLPGIPVDGISARIREAWWQAGVNGAFYTPESYSTEFGWEAGAGIGTIAVLTMIVRITKETPKHVQSCRQHLGHL